MQNYSICNFPTISNIFPTYFPNIYQIVSTSFRNILKTSYCAEHFLNIYTGSTCASDTIFRKIPRVCTCLQAIYTIFTTYLQHVYQIFTKYLSFFVYKIVTKYLPNHFWKYVGNEIDMFGKYVESANSLNLRFG